MEENLGWPLGGCLGPRACPPAHSLHSLSCDVQVLFRTLLLLQDPGRHPQNIGRLPSMCSRPGTAEGHVASGLQQVGRGLLCFLCAVQDWNTCHREAALRQGKGNREATCCGFRSAGRQVGASGFESPPPTALSPTACPLIQLHSLTW